MSPLLLLILKAHGTLLLKAHIFVCDIKFKILCASAKHSVDIHIHLKTGYNEYTAVSEMQEKLEELKQSLLKLDIGPDIELDPNMHDREIRFDNSWVVKIGRGLDLYQKPDSWRGIGE